MLERLAPVAVLLAGDAYNCACPISAAVLPVPRHLIGSTLSKHTMSDVSLAERDEQLVVLLRNDKREFLRQYRRILSIADDVSLTGLLDREMICAILDHEFPDRHKTTTPSPE